MRLRVISYNVHGFRAGLDAAVHAVAGEKPDVVCLQECGSKRAVHAFARAMGMQAVSSHRAFNRVRNAVAYRSPWRAMEHRAVDLSRDGRSMRRGYLSVRLGASGSRITVVSVHLGLTEAERERHAVELTDAVAGIPAPVVVGGDLNEGPDGAAVRWISARLFDAFAVAGSGPGATLPARAPRTRVDYLMVGEGITVASARVVDTEAARTASDHLSVVADVLWDVPGVS
jgi:endonuclease/exonuclease/phosphatase family metal-dependent hydrolase